MIRNSRFEIGEECSLQLCQYLLKLAVGFWLWDADGRGSQPPQGLYVKPFPASFCEISAAFWKHYWCQEGSDAGSNAETNTVENFGRLF